MDSAARAMAAHMSEFERARAILDSDRDISWVRPGDTMDEIYSGRFPPHPPITNARRANYQKLAAFLKEYGYRDLASVQKDGMLKLFRLVMVEPGYSGRQQLVEGVWFGNGETVSDYSDTRHTCRAVRAPHWFVCQLN